MADRANPRPPGKPPPQRTDLPGSHQPRQRETAEERRSKRTAAALATQVDLKREAAERRDRKNQS
jgi:hypothetical protein